MKVYKAVTLWGYKKPGHGPPNYNVILAELVPEVWWPWFHDAAVSMRRMNKIPDRWTNQDMINYMVSKQVWHYRNKSKSWGTASNFALHQGLAIKGKMATGIGILAVGLMLGVIAIGLFFGLADWFEGCAGHLSFGPDAFILRYRERFWLAGFMGRPTSRDFDFLRGREIDAPIVYERRPLGWGRGVDSWLYFETAWQEFRNTITPWHIFTVEDLRVTYLGLAHDRGFGYYRLRLPADLARAIGVPIGFGRTEYEALLWQDDLFADFSC